MKFSQIIVSVAITLISCNEAANEPTESFITINEHKIHVKSVGKGKPIVFVHGGYLDLDMWDEQVNEFKDSYKLIRFSDLGHGETIQAKEPLFGYEIIKQIVSNHSDEKITLVGLSWGAMLCVDFTLNYQEEVDKLILVSPGLNGWNYFKDNLASQNHTLRQEAIKNMDTLKSSELFHQNWVVGPRRQIQQLNEPFSSKSLAMVLKNTRNHWQEDWSKLDTIAARSRLENITIPTYIIVGNQDAQDILLIADEYNQRIKNSQKIEMQNVGHLLNMENSKEFNTILSRIIEK